MPSWWLVGRRTIVGKLGGPLHLGQLLKDTPTLRRRQNQRNIGSFARTMRNEQDVIWFQLHI
jgi:hypothetical protein